MDEPPHRQVPILDEASVYGARQAVREVASAVGFDRLATEEMVLVVSELVTNILKYAGRGEIEVRGLHDPKRGRGLQIVARDQGPPIDDFDAAQQDGWSQGGPIDPTTLFRRKGIGGGLGAVRRLTDELVYRALPQGKEISASRFARVRRW